MLFRSVEKERLVNCLNYSLLHHHQVRKGNDGLSIDYLKSDSINVVFSLFLYEVKRIYTHVPV